MLSRCLSLLSASLVAAGFIAPAVFRPWAPLAEGESDDGLVPVIAPVTFQALLMAVAFQAGAPEASPRYPLPPGCQWCHGIGGGTDWVPTAEPHRENKNDHE